MGKALLLALVVMLVPLSSQAGSRYHSCDRKIDKLEAQLYRAMDHGNKHKVSKLKKKIHETRYNCYDSRSGATKLYDYYPQRKSSELERELASLQSVIEALKDLK
ncbi:MULTISPECIES: DUF1090 family protein [Providencia]|uniref:DUF1090 family protein n=1 Tax=Providencia TaxID=586 RepID=UPI00083835C0|nr:MULTISPECIES: DUF1090 family protein [Providencia]MBP6121890.1 DUF1090 family protein [Providencia sp.]MDD9340370.1 DUF1090 family protein [Providencia heimbachae]NIH23099.1 DUF1090 family protein [Providencia heimbachae]